MDRQIQTGASPIKQLTDTKTNEGTEVRFEDYESLQTAAGDQSPGWDNPRLEYHPSNATNWFVTQGISFSAV